MFTDREISERAKRAIEGAVGEEGKVAEHKNEAEEEILKLTHHEKAYFFSSCGSAIFASLYGVKKLFLPDQGVWKGVLKIAELLKIETIKIPTTLGLISAEDIEKVIKKENNDNAAFFVSSFAGYVAEQDIKALSEICREKNVLLIEDASGAIGDKNLASGEYSDIIVCSTGTPKIINLNSGGFLTTSHTKIRENAEKFEKLFKIYPFLYPAIAEEAKSAGKAVEKLIESSFIIKRNVENAIFKELRGVCAGILLENPNDFAKKAGELGMKTEKGKTLLTLCPRYDRFLKNGAVIELKKLDVSERSRKDTERIIYIINSNNTA